MEIYEEIRDRFIREQFKEVARLIKEIKVEMSVLESIVHENNRINDSWKRKIEKDRGY